LSPDVGVLSRTNYAAFMVALEQEGLGGLITHTREEASLVASTAGVVEAMDIQTSLKAIDKAREAISGELGFEVAPGVVQLASVRKIHEDQLRDKQRDLRSMESMVKTERDEEKRAAIARKITVRKSEISQLEEKLKRESDTIEQKQAQFENTQGTDVNKIIARRVRLREALGLTPVEDRISEFRKLTEKKKKLALTDAEEERYESLSKEFEATESVRGAEMEYKVSARGGEEIKDISSPVVAKRVAEYRKLAMKVEGGADLSLEEQARYEELGKSYQLDVKKKTGFFGLFGGDRELDLKATEYTPRLEPALAKRLEEFRFLDEKLKRDEGLTAVERQRYDALKPSFRREKKTEVIGGREVSFYETVPVSGIRGPTSESENIMRSVAAHALNVRSQTASASAGVLADVLTQQLEQNTRLPENRIDQIVGKIQSATDVRSFMQVFSDDQVRADIQKTDVGRYLLGHRGVIKRMAAMDITPSMSVSKIAELLPTQIAGEEERKRIAQIVKDSGLEKGIESVHSQTLSQIKGQKWSSSVGVVEGIEQKTALKNLEVQTGLNLAVYMALSGLASQLGVSVPSLPSK